MTEALATFAAEAATVAIQFMADKAGVSFEVAARAIASGDAGAQRQFKGLIEGLQATFRAEAT